MVRSKMYLALVIAVFVVAGQVSAAVTTIYVDPTGDASDTTWNNYAVTGTSAATLSDAAALLDTTGAATGITIKETGSFAADQNDAGSIPAALSAAVEFTPCGTNSAFGSTDVSRACPAPQLTFTGMTSGTEYTVTFYSSRSGTGTRNTILTLTCGANSAVSPPLDGYGNSTDVASVSIVADGSTMVMDVGTDNAQYWYLNAFKIEYETTSIPEPATMSLLALGCAILMRRRRTV